MRKGSLLSELLIVVFVLCLLMPYLYEGILKSSALKFDYKMLQDEISTLQLRRILALSYDLEVNSNVLYFEYENKDYYLSYKNESIQMSPGTQIFYDEVLDYEFKVKDEVISLVLIRKEGSFEYLLASQKGIDFASFSDCPTDDFELESELSASSED